MARAMKSPRKCFVRKILAVNHCSSRIISQISPNPIIPIDQGEGGVPTPNAGFPFWERTIFLIAISLSLFFSVAQANAQPSRGTLVHEATMRVSPSADSANPGEAQRAPDFIITDTTRHRVHVPALIPEPQK